MEVVTGDRGCVHVCVCVCACVHVCVCCVRAYVHACVWVWVGEEGKKPERVPEVET